MEEYSNGYEHYLDGDMREICEDKKIVVIAGRDKELYNEIILEKFQRFDQIEIQVLDAYLDKALVIIKLWEALGIMPVNGYPIRFEKREEDITTKDKKKTYKGYINKILLTKQPEQFRFTKN